MVRAASYFGSQARISDVAFKKRCAKLGVPTPPRGYWAKLEAGKKVNMPPLPVQVTELARRKKKAKSPDSHEYFTTEATSYELAHPHEIVRAAKTGLRSARADREGFLHSGSESGFLLQVTKESETRALWIADTLLKAFAERGSEIGAVAGYGGGTHIKAFGEQAKLRIKEKLNRYDNPAYDPKKKYSWPDEPDRYVHKASGKLRLTVEYSEWVSGSKEWIDKPNSPLDGRLDEIVEDIMAGLEQCRVSRIQRAEQAKLERERQHQTWLRQQEIEAENKRRQRLEELAKDLVMSERILALVARLDLEADQRVLASEELDRLKNWKSWALAQAERLDPTSRLLDKIIRPE